METPIIFINWSGARSREIAHILKELLCDIYKLKSENIFVSDTSIAGSRPWLEAIRNSASLISIAIPCLTIDNTEAPWIHYEIGLCSYILQDQDEYKKEKAIIPFLFNFDIKDLNPHLTMLSYHQSVTSDMTIENEEIRFQELLYSLIHQVDHCMADKGLSEYCHRFGNNERHLKRMCSGFVYEYANKLVKINQKYNKHDFYLSRPMLGVNKETSDQISSIINQIYQECKNKKIYYSQGVSDYDKDNLLESRITIIKKCRSFILIYPQIASSDSLPPSSCLIELGAALATNSKIFLCIQNGAKVPSFIQDKTQDKNNKNYQIYQFKEITELLNILLEIINSND